jgi:hypothetical protein
LKISYSKIICRRRRRGCSVSRRTPFFCPTRLIRRRGCSWCDYRGTFNAEGGGQKFLPGCSEPSQRFYHVPRSFLKARAETTMVLFQEAGGDPSRVDFHTVAVHTACAEVGDEVALACSHCRTISRASIARTRAGVSH